MPRDEQLGVELDREGFLVPEVRVSQGSLVVHRFANERLISMKRAWFQQAGKRAANEGARIAIISWSACLARRRAELFQTMGVDPVGG